MQVIQLFMSRLIWPLALFILLISNSTSFAQVYKYEDEEGNVVYSDTPPVDNQAMEPAELPDIIFQPSVEVPENFGRSSESEADDLSVSIITPENEATIHNGEAAVGVSAGASRPLKNNESAFLLVNGSEHSSSNSLTWSVTELERGEMQLVVQIRDLESEILAVSESVTVFVQRASVRPVPVPARAN